MSSEDKPKFRADERYTFGWVDPRSSPVYSDSEVKEAPPSPQCKPILRDRLRVGLAVIITKITDWI